jgi:hypothetical protein
MEKMDDKPPCPELFIILFGLAATLNFFLAQTT